MTRRYRLKIKYRETLGNTYGWVGAPARGTVVQTERSVGAVATAVAGLSKYVRELMQSAAVTNNLNN